MKKQLPPIVTALAVSSSSLRTTSNEGISNPGKIITGLILQSRTFSGALQHWIQNIKKPALSLLVLLFLIGGVGKGWGQTTVFSDDFSTNTSATYTTSGAIGASAWSVTRLGADWGARRNTSPLQLETTNDVGATGNVIGWVFASTPTTSFLSPYSTTLGSGGKVTWTFNMRQIRPDPAGFAVGSYGVAFILAGSSTTAATLGNGYAVVLGQSGSTDPIRLIKYTTGLQGTIANIITSNTAGLTDFGADYLSIKVTYNPCASNQWELFLRNDGTTAFADPLTGTLFSQGTASDNTYTGTSLANLGAYWQGSTTAAQDAFFDNVTVTAFALPSVTCPANITVCQTDTPFALTGGMPNGGTYSGTGVSMGMFDPSSGNGNHTITYTVTDVNMCSASCTFIITVTAATTFYGDLDGDGLGDPAVTIMACTAPPGYVANNTDACPLSIVSNSGNCGCAPGSYPIITVISGQNVITGCQTCPAGSYCPDGLIGPILCPPGKYSDVTGAVACTNCAAGSYNGISGATSCVLCPPGQFSDVTGATTCTLCDAGYYNPSPGATGCTLCEAGKYNPSPGATECTPCEAGKYSDMLGSTQCTPCPAGSYNGQTGATSCLLCPPGQYSGQTGSIACASCPPGSYNPSPGATECTLCEAGKYNPDPGAIECTPCEAGKYNPDPGATACTPCPIGQFSNMTGSTECMDCPNGTYNTQEGQTECLACPTAICPVDVTLCINAGILDLTTLTYSPLGGTFSGSGVSMNNFDPTVAGPGPHIISYTYMDGNNCTGTCMFTINVNSLPVVVCPPSFSVSELDDPFALTGATPPGGTYFGAGVTMNQFDPSAVSPGPHLITYTYSNGMCTNTCTFVITVTSENGCTPLMEWVLLPPGFQTGFGDITCNSETDCCEDILCYGLQYTPCLTGDLLDYTTGFIANCIGGNSPVISNMSCTMDDNSFEINACMTDNLILFNSSGNNGQLPVMAGVPTILHKVCYSVPIGESLTIIEDTITDLTTSIEVDPDEDPLVERPEYVDFTITRTPLAEPQDDFATVQCVESAVPPVTPVVLDQCGSPVTPMLSSIMDNPDPLVCEGTRVYTYVYNACGDYMVDWKFTYTIDHTMNPSEVGMPVPTMASVNGIDNAGPPLLPVVEDVCGHTLDPMLVSITDSPDPIICGGTRVYIYKWTDCSGLMFNWTFTYNINNVPILSCPANITVCSDVPPFALTGGTPSGGTYSGAGVTMNTFDPVAAGLGPHTITYAYTNAQGCTNSCTFQITVAPVPTVTCRPNASVCSFEAPFEITGCNPPGGVFSGAGVTGNMFDPAAAGLGPHTITYTVTSMNGCTKSCSFVFNVTQCPGPPLIEIIPLDPCDNAGPYGSCTYEGSCCDNILCFAIRYTPGYSGMLTSYTTGFFINCVGGLSPVVYNQSCVMNDNSFEAPMCEGGVILFNSSGNEGTLPITVGVPVILHRICFMVPPGTSLNIIEDIITDLTCSIDLTGGGQINEYPAFTPVTITRTPPVINVMDQSSTVACLAYATAPMPPTDVVDQCCSPVLGVLYSIVDTPDPLTCAGTRVYTYRYTDCGGAYSEWHYTYTIVPVDFVLPLDGDGTVACPSQATAAAVPLPNVLSNCGLPLSPVAGPFQNYYFTDTYSNCEGTISYTWIYRDCALADHPWTYTFNIVRLDFTLPSNTGSMVPCSSAATAANVPLPTVFSNCMEPLMAGPAVQNKFMTDTYNGCQGTISFTYTYSDCAGHTHDWTYTFNVVRLDFMLPPNNGTMVPCPSAATAANVPLPMNVTSNCMEPLMAGPAVQNKFMTDTYNGCQGTISFTYTYTDCAGHMHDWTYTFNVVRFDFTVPPGTGTMVPCPALATPANVPVPMNVLSNCMEPITPGAPVQDKFESDTYNGCQGTISFTYTYTDCAGHMHDWTYTFNVVRFDFTVPPGTGTMVPCPALATPANVPVPMNVLSNCMEPIMPGAPVLNKFLTDTYNGCQGTISYTYTYADCAGHMHDWTYTFNVLRLDFMVPVNDTTIVPFAILALPGFVPVPVVTSDCGEPLTPTGPFSNYYNTDTYNGCEGTISYTYFFTDCAMHSHAWTYAFSVIRPDFMLLNPTGFATVGCPLLAIASNVLLPTVFDAEGIPLTPGPALQNYFGTDNFNGFEGTISFTWFFTDCAMHSHPYTYTFTVTCPLPAEVGPPASTSSDIDCYLNAAPPAVLPIIGDGCGSVISPTGPIIGGTNTGNCGGTITYSYTYTNCEGTPYVWVYTYNVTCVPIQLKVWLEGAYSTTGDSMATTINQLHRLPGQLNGPFIFDAPAGQPYITPPWNYLGNLGIQYGDASMQTPYPPDVVDWVLVSIRKNGILPIKNIWTCAGWVHKNGDVTFPEDCPLPAFAVQDTYYFVVQHRHHLGILSPGEVNMPCGTAILEWDFRNSNSFQPVFRYGQKEVETGVWAMFTGNGEQLASISSINSFDRTIWKVWQGFSGYNPADYIMDGFTDGFDETVWKNNQNRTSGIVFY